MGHVYRFYVPPDSLTAGTELTLPTEESHHALHVVRVREGDTVEVFDGAGNEAHAVVRSAGRKDVTLTVLGRRTVAPLKTRLTIVQAALHREDAVEELIRRGTELGVAAFRFFPATHSERPPKPKEKWKRYAVDACKQSRRAWLPRIETAGSLEAALKESFETILIATPHGEARPLRGVLREGNDIALIVGPEGDFTDEEVELALNAGAIPISFGAATYRSEVAAILGATLILYERGQFGAN